ncbi:MAG: hypothetical protein KJO40_19495 [Deltaproteobacteria bacterium]|nr:hypothetical protein [Deltaproteobacteria bacterium]
MEELLKHYLTTDKDIQIKLKGDLALVQGVGGIGPGKVLATDWPGIYKIEQQAQMQTAQGPRVVSMPFMFRAADVVWISEGPQGVEEPSIVSPQESGINLPSA